MSKIKYQNDMPKIPGYLPIRDILKQFDIDRTTLMGMRRRGEVKSFNMGHKKAYCHVEDTAKAVAALREAQARGERLGVGKGLVKGKRVDSGDVITSAPTVIGEAQALPSDLRRIVREEVERSVENLLKTIIAMTPQG